MTTPQQKTSTNGRQHQRIIGITGGIGMGKTTISDYLIAEYKIPVLDADLIAREMVVPASPVSNRIVERYGPAILLPDGQLNRMQLGKIVFSSPPERHWLERQIHPLVRDRLEHELHTPPLRLEPIIVLVVPLLFEARMTDLVNEIWVVFCTPEQQMERLLQRSIRTMKGNSQLSPSQVKKRIESQMPIERKIQHADVVLDNSQSEQVLFQHIDQAMKSYPTVCSDHPKE